MTIMQFKYVIEITKCGSINAAARNLFISQSVLSTAVKKLESELGYDIFSRTSKGIKLTPFGEEFLSCIKPIHMQIERLYNMSSRGRENYAFSLSISSLGYYFLADILANLQQKYKSLGVYISSFEGSLDEIINAVYEKSSEFALIRLWDCYKSVTTNQFKAMKLRFYPIASLDIGVTVGKHNPLFNQESPYVICDQLKDYPVVMYPYMDNGPYSDVYTILDLPTPKNKYVTTSRAMVYELLNLTDAYHLNSIYHIDKKNLFPILDATPFPQRTLLLTDCQVKSEVGWIQREDATLSPLALEAISDITDYITGSISK